MIGLANDGILSAVPFASYWGEWPVNQLSSALNAHQTIRERILAVEVDLDELTLAETLEGLTDLHEVVAAVLRSALIDEAMADGLKEHIRLLQERLRRFTDRAMARRQIARDAMVEAHLRKIAAPDFTLSVRPGSPAIQVIDEAAIPEAYWQPREPRLDRIGLLNDLKKGVAVTGVQLSNPEPVLSVRVR
jgi:hypothetical protein